MTGKIESDWIIKTPGIVFALAMAVKAYTEPGESVLNAAAGFTTRSERSLKTMEES